MFGIDATTSYRGNGRNADFVMLLTVEIGLTRGEVDLTLTLDHSILQRPPGSLTLYGCPIAKELESTVYLLRFLDLQLQNQ